ncbi:MAG: cytochrome c oxidase subunit II [Nitrospinota bacterium]
MLRWLPENASSYGANIDSIFYLIYYIVAGWFVLVLGLLVYFLVRYRRREGRRAKYAAGNTLRQAAWILVPAVVVLAMDLWIDFRGAEVWDLVKRSHVRGEVLVRLNAEQFNWEIVYPGPDGKFGTKDDVKMESELHVPVDKVVSVRTHSKDVIHSLFIPTFRIKQDIIPGRDIETWFKATKTGKFEMPCAELCGFGHSGMKGWVIVHTAEGYEKWKKEKWRSAREGSVPAVSPKTGAARARPADLKRLAQSEGEK